MIIYYEFIGKHSSHRVFVCWIVAKILAIDLQNCKDH